MLSEPMPVPAGWRLLAENAGFVEGPVDGGAHVDFVSINRGMVYRARLDGGGYEPRAELGGGPNGAAIDHQGRLWVAQNGGRVIESKSEITAEPGVQVIDVDGSFSTELGRPDLSAPNDCAFGPDGRLWFTDPYGRLMPDPPGDPERMGRYGRVWAYDPASHDMELVAENLRHPNGLCFEPGGDALYVSDTRTREILVLDVAGDGVRTTRVFGVLPGGGPDGIALDSAGRLWVTGTTADYVGVLSPDGSWEFIAFAEGSFPTNVCFAGPDLSTVVVTLSFAGQVVASNAEIPGIPLLLGSGGSTRP